MSLMALNGVSIGFGGPLVLDKVSLRIEPGERIGLVGRNGAGKSTLMKLISDELAPDEGLVVKDDVTHVAMLPQEIPSDVPGTVYDVVASGGSKSSALLKEYHELTQRLSHQVQAGGLLRELEGVQQRLEASGAWQFHHKVQAAISATGLDENAVFAHLSAGLKRRAILARALALEPDILLLDEPTNHLDIDAILWLEDFLLACGRTIMFVTHDRAFLKRLATRIVEIDRGGLTSYDCGYAAYLERRQALIDALERQVREFDKKLAQEEVWVRRGLEARRTRNEGRVRALTKMRSERELRRAQTGTVRLLIQEAERSGRLVAAAENIGFSYGESPLIRAFSTTILRGDKVGVIGPNGAGKTTLLKLLLGDIAPLTGTLRHGARLKIAYFDQLRSQLNDEQSLMDNITAGGDTIFIDGEARHIVGYLQGFLFTREQIMAPARKLSGGERNRLLLAKLFSVPSNCLVLDEPTNDLDSETLELLEDRLVAYDGTVLMVSHDREFLNNVVTSTIVFEGDGLVREYVGGYDDWLRQRPAKPVEQRRGDGTDKPPPRPREKKKLSFKEMRELEGLPGRIEDLEAEHADLIAVLNDPAFQTGSDARTIHAADERRLTVEKELDEAYRRWQELEELSEKLGA
ncbi:MAG: ATP-binding cassette domain-containing protein [Syntrophaceae bacterium]